MIVAMSLVKIFINMARREELSQITLFLPFHLVRRETGQGAKEMITPPSKIV